MNSWIKLSNGIYLNLSNVMYVDATVQEPDAIDTDGDPAIYIYGVGPYPLTIKRDSEDASYVMQQLDLLVSGKADEQWRIDTEDGLF